MTSTDRPRRLRGPGPFRGLRGWGGVSAMAGACVLTAVLTLLPLAHTTSEGLESSEQRTSTALPAKAEDCPSPEASLRPVNDNNAPGVKAIRDRKGDDRKLIVGVDQNSYRWGARNPDTGDLEGFDIDLAKAIAADILGSPDAIVFRTIPTNQRTEALKSGTVDLVVRTMTITCDRLKDVSFSTAYFQTGQQILVPKGSTITGYDESLAGKRVCTAEGSIANETLKSESFGAIFEDENEGKPSDKDQLTVPNQLDCLVRLQLDEVDALMTDNALAAGQAAQDPAVELRGKPLKPEYYGVAAKRGNDDLVRRVNHVLEEYRAGGPNSPWMKSYERWLAAGLPGITKPPTATYKD
ncbi:glutamate ABC transporter substrate-binding protein [Streptomyces sp. NPDC057539]|uniref:glutamate ABC transporter substrate-binding protein n=1 Tax=Streptomyces sp. NPDC057539 TaxID=3346159 RepID=UPI0036791BE2